MTALEPHEMKLADASVSFWEKTKIRVTRFVRFVFSTTFMVVLVFGIGIGAGVLYFGAAYGIIVFAPENSETSE